MTTAAKVVATTAMATKAAATTKALELAST